MLTKTQPAFCRNEKGARMNDIHGEVYKEEARELLSELETSLLELEERPDDQELVGRVFRAMHTIKGSGAMFGFDEIAAFTHEVETVYDKVRKGEMPITKTLIGRTLQAKDIIKFMLDGSPAGEDIEGPDAAEIMDAFKRLAADGGGIILPPPSPAASPSGGDSSPSPAITYRVRFTPDREIFLAGTNLIILLNELHALGECTIVAHREVIPLLAELNPEHCYTFWDVLLTTNRDINAIKDVFIFVEDQCRLEVSVIDRPLEADGGEGYKKLGEILVEKGDVNNDALQKILSEKKFIGETLIERGLTTPDKVAAALAEQEHVRSVREKMRPKDETAASIRVTADKLDVLVNLVGELVTVQARLSQTASILQTNEILSIAEEVERLTGELRDNTLNIRMLPIGTTFGRFKRLVHDLSRELGKEIELTTAGEETELDKTVIEKLNDPLVHLIRNCIDHGIESPEARVSRNKSRTGTIHLSASHSGAHVMLQIRDDGKGLDKEFLLAKAVEKGFVGSHADLTEKEIFNLIFLPGFSTAKTVTNVSGRGVGMDVVKRAMDALRGTIEISSVKDIGATITIKLPLTLAIIDGLLVKIGEDHFILPLSVVDECVELTRQDVADAHGQDLAKVRGELVPYIPLRQRFGIGGTPPAIQQIVATRVDGSRIGLVVDQVVGEHQTVLKPLGRMYRGVDEVSGATILGDGKVALIIDIPKLIQKAEKDKSVVKSKYRSSTSPQPAAERAGA